MARHSPCDWVDGVFDLDALLLEHLGHLAQRVLRLRHRHAVARDDDDLLGLLEHEGGVRGAALLVGALLARLAAARCRVAGAETARDHREEAAVHRPAHDVAEDRARGADQRAGDDHRGVAQREPHRRRRPARIAVEHRDHDRHVRPADGDDQQEADHESRGNHRPEQPALARPRVGRHGIGRGARDDRR